MKASLRISLCGVMSAMATVVLLMSTFPYATYAIAAFAGMLMLPVALECGTRYGILSYAVTAVLALFLTPDPEAKLLFVMFFGYYPLAHLRLQRFDRQWLSWLLKFALFNIAAVADFWLLTHVVNIPRDEFVIAGAYVPGVLLLAGNLLLIVYDIALVRVGGYYRVKLHPFVKKIWKL